MLSIDKYTVHILNYSDEETILADYGSRAESKNIVKLLKKCIKKVQKDKKNTIKANWDNEVNEEKNLVENCCNERNLVQNCCETILNEEDSFIKISKEIAAYYHNQNLISKTNILVICCFTEFDIKNVAILRLENKQMFTTIVNCINEKFSVDIIENENILSNTLQSGAIIEDTNLAKLYDLKIYEREDLNQSKFINNFLFAKMIRDDTYKTKTFIDIARMYISKSYNEDMEAKENATRLLAHMLINTSNMDIDKFIEMSEIDGDIKKTIEKYEIKNSFNIDKEVVNKEFKNRSIETDTGFLIKANRNTFENDNAYEIIKNPDGTVNIVLKGVKCFYE